jgi:transposase
VVSQLSSATLLDSVKKNGNYKFREEDAQELIDLAAESIGVPDPDNAYAFRIMMNAARLRHEIECLKRMEKEIESMAEGNTDIEYIADMRGMSVVAAASIVSEIARIEQFDSALKLQSYARKCLT